jgi:hypothetical protein
MKALAHSFAVRQQQSFAIHVLKNEEVEIAVVPELGARIISLKNLRTGRDWMWHPAGGLKLFRNCPGDDFAQGPLAGVDECLPTIAACCWQGRVLPDHGEVWSEPWRVDSEAWEGGILKTSIKLGISPFEFERTLELSGHEVHLGYRLTNVNTQEESFLWAIHPLLKLCPGDRLEAPASTAALLNGTAWVDAVESAIPENHYAKVFAGPISEGWVAINNQRTGDRLELEWDPAENDTLGLWLTRGGWHGHHHFAPEPTNADTDTLTLAAERNCCGVVPASASVTWGVRLRVD